MSFIQFFSETVDYVSFLNYLWQTNTISEPQYVFNAGEPWTCTCSCIFISTKEVFTGDATATTKKEAKQLAASVVYNKIIAVSKHPSVLHIQQFSENA